MSTALELVIELKPARSYRSTGIGVALLLRINPMLGALAMLMVGAVLIWGARAPDRNHHRNQSAPRWIATCLRSMRGATCRLRQSSACAAKGEPGVEVRAEQL